MKIKARISSPYRRISSNQTAAAVPLAPVATAGFQNRRIMGKRVNRFVWVGMRISFLALPLIGIFFENAGRATPGPELKKPASLPLWGRNAGLPCDSPALKSLRFALSSGVCLSVKRIQIGISGQNKDAFTRFCADIRVETDQFAT